VTPEILSFIALFFIVFILMKFLEKIVKDITTKINITSADRVLGFLFGVVEGFCFVAFLFFLISVQPLFDPSPLMQGSFFDRLFKPFF
jgi:uncharacterized membrane protein required for colicin V production